MTRQFDADRILEDWLADIPSRLPDRVVEAIVADIDRTPQRMRFGLPRREDMNRLAFALGTVAAGLLVVLVGLGLFYNQPGVGGPGASPSPSPTADPTATQHATEAPTAEPSLAPAATPLPRSQALEEGTYYTDVGRHRLTFTVSDAWTSFEHWALMVDEAEPPSGAFLMFHGGVKNVYADACQWVDTQLSPSPGPSIDDFAAALTAVEDRTVSEPTEVIVGGHRALYLQVRAPEIDFASCHDGQFTGVVADTYDIWHISPGETWDVWLIDVDGARFFINSIRYPDTPSEIVDEIAEIVASLELEPN
jgi:hypothetical protein